MILHNGKAYDQDGNIIPRDEARGKIKNGECGSGLCSCQPASMWDTFKDIYICLGCAEELNQRNRIMHGLDYPIRATEPPPEKKEA